MAAITRLSLDGYGARPAGSFAGKRSNNSGGLAKGTGLSYGKGLQTQTPIGGSGLDLPP